MKLNYNSREIFFGNEALIVADMAQGSNGKRSEEHTSELQSP